MSQKPAVFALTVLALSAFMLVSTSAMADDDAQQPAKTEEAAPKQEAKKPEASHHTSEKGDKTAAVKPKPAGFQSEGEAHAKCHGTVVWVGAEGFNHYRGSREYGVKPGHFACER